MTVKLHFTIRPWIVRKSLSDNYRSQYDHHVINYSWARGGRGTIGIWESGSGQGCVSWCSNSRVMFKEVARKVQRGRSVRLRNLCAVSLILRLQGAGASAQTRNTCSPWSLQQNWETKKTGLNIAPLPCNSFVNPNSALPPDSRIFFFSLGLTVTH